MFARGGEVLTSSLTGLLEHKATTVQRGDGSEKVVESVRITAKGVTKLAELLGAGEVVATAA